MRMGISTADDTTIAGLFSEAGGIDPFSLPGTLVGGYTPSQIGTAVVADTIKYFCPTVGSGVYNFGYGDAGKLYRINLTTDAVELLRTVAGSTGNGLALYKSAVYYSLAAALGKMTSIEAGTPTFDDAFAAFTNSLAEHPLHVFQNKLYCGDKDHIDSNDGTTHSDNVLDIPSDYTIIDIDDDGYYLVIAAVKKTGGLTRTENKIFFWDTINPYTWSVEYGPNELDGEITGISKIGGRKMVAFTGAGMYFFTVSSSPQIFLESTASGYGPFAPADFQPFAGALVHWRGCLAWASNGHIFTYGRVLPNLPKIIAKPVILASIKSIAVNAFDWVLASTTANKLYKIRTGNAGGGFETGVIDLKGPYLITRIKVFNRDLLASAHYPRVRLVNETGTAEIDISFLSSVYGTTKRSHWGTGEIQAQFLRILIDLTGFVTFRKLEVYGIPLSKELTI